MNPIHLPKILKSSLKKKSTNPILRAIIPLFPSTTMTPTCDCLSWISNLLLLHTFPCKKIPIPSKKNPSLKNISWPVPLTSFGPRFKRKKKTNPSNYSSEEHYSNKNQHLSSLPQVAIFFLLLLNLTIIYFSWRDYLSYNYIHTNQEFFDLCAIYDAVNVDEPIKTTFPPRKLHKLLFWLFLAFHFQ